MKISRYALMLAIMQLLMVGNISKTKAENSYTNDSQKYYILDENRRIVVVDNPEDVYKDKNESISIFSNKNMHNNQYGGSQTDFFNNFDELIFYFFYCIF